MSAWKQRAVDHYNQAATWIQARRPLVLGGVVGLFLCIAIALIAWPIFFPQPVAIPNYSPFQSKAEYEQFMAKHPLMSRVAPAGASFVIHGNVSKDRRAEYTVELFAPALKPNNPESAKRYLEALKKSQAEAQAWIKTTGEPSEGLYVAWTPNPDVLGSEYKQPPIPQRKAASPTPTVKSGPTPVFPH